MPFRTNMTSQTAGVIHLYNIDYAIGCGGWNHWADVKLVQSLLRLFYYDMAGGYEHDPPPSGEYEPPVIDGYCGPVTRRYLMHYQQQAHMRGEPVLIDGRFDPYRKGNRLSTYAKVQYQLEALNFRCAKYCHFEKLDWFSNLMQRPYVAEHPDLVKALCCPPRTMAQQYCYRN